MNQKRDIEIFFKPVNKNAVVNSVERYIHSNQGGSGAIGTAFMEMADAVMRPLTEWCSRLTDVLAASVSLKWSNISSLIVQIMSNSDPPSLTNAGMNGVS